MKSAEIQKTLEEKLETALVDPDPVGRQPSIPVVAHERPPNPFPTSSGQPDEVLPFILRQRRKEKVMSFVDKLKKSIRPALLLGIITAAVLGYSHFSSEKTMRVTACIDDPETRGYDCGEPLPHALIALWSGEDGLITEEDHIQTADSRGRVVFEIGEDETEFGFGVGAFTDSAVRDLLGQSYMPAAVRGNSHQTNVIYVPVDTR